MRKRSLRSLPITPTSEDAEPLLQSRTVAPGPVGKIRWESDFQLPSSAWCNGTVLNGWPQSNWGGLHSIPGVVFAGSLDGLLLAYDSRDGSVLWDFDTAQEFQTTNGLRAHGGSLNGAGPAVLSGMLYVNTGYTNAMAGNVLLAFALDPADVQ